MTAKRLARQLGLDGNPLRRRTDKIAVSLAALLVVVFAIGTPALSIAAIGWIGHTGAGRQQAALSRYVVRAVLRQATQMPSVEGGIGRISLVQARWTAPDGRARSGAIPVTVGLAAGSTVPLWVDVAGWPTGPPPSHSAVLARESAAAVGITVTLAILLLCLAGGGRWVINRRRAADWEAAWAAVGPQWTRRFRSRD
jgi:hypothetical protein